MRTPSPLIRALALFLLVAARPAIAQIECDCANTGDYVDPAEPTPITTGPTGLSPGGKYLLSATGSSPIQIVIHRISDNAVVFNQSIPFNSAWGFSSDDDGFVYHYTNGNVHPVYLFNLASGSPAPVWSSSYATSSMRLLFSPHGAYFYSAALTGTQFANLDIVERATGRVAYSVGLPFQVVGGSGEDSFGTVGWGFSPDAQDRSFVYGFVTGINTVQLELVNLGLGRPATEVTLNAISSFWQFSPCGDVLALLQQTGPSQTLGDLFTTAGGANVGEHGDAVAAIAFRSTGTSHVENVGGIDYPLTANTAGTSCSIVPHLVGLHVAPSIVTGGNTATVTLSLSGPAQAGQNAAVTSSDPVNAPAPSTVPLAIGQTVTSFDMSTLEVVSDETVTVGATLDAVHVQGSFQLQAPPPPALAFIATDSPIPGGQEDGLTIQMTSGVVGGPIDIALSSSNPSLVSLPPSISLNDGQTLAFLNYTPPAVPTDETVMISASYAGVVRTCNVTILGPRPKSFQSSGTCAVSGTQMAVVLELTSIAPAGAVTAFVSSSDPAHLSLPSSIAVAEGEQIGSVEATVQGVTSEIAVDVTVTLNGVTATGTVTLLPPQDWVLTELGPPGHESAAYALNIHGDAAGYWRTGIATPVQACYWKNGTLVPLSPLLPDPYTSIALGINDAGVVVGGEDHYPEHAFMFDGVTMTLLFSDNLDSEASAVNNAGQIVGVHGGIPFLYDGTAHDLPLLTGTTNGMATAINAQGDAVGWCGGAYQERACLWPAGGGVQELPVLPGWGQALAYGINDAGLVVGWCRNPGFIAVQWVNGVPEALDGSFSQAWGVDNAGAVVGTSESRPVIWYAAQRFPVDSLTSGSCSQPVSPLRAINDAGQAAGSVYYSDLDGEHAAIVTPSQLLVAVERSPVSPTRLSIEMAGPNPVRGPLALRCALPLDMPASVELLDVTGRRVAAERLDGVGAGVTLVRLPHPSVAAPGIYFVRLTQAGRSVSRRVTLLK
jgi:uncharacterized membrane protein